MVAASLGVNLPDAMALNTARLAVAVVGLDHRSLPVGHHEDEVVVLVPAVDLFIRLLLLCQKRLALCAGPGPHPNP